MDMTLDDLKRRKMLQTAATAVGGIAAISVAIPFIESMQPSEAAKAAGAPVEVDIGTIRPGQLLTVAWRGKPVWILHRTDAMLASLDQHDALLADPLSEQVQQPAAAANPSRALRPPFLVLVGICTHLGCVPSFRPEPGGAELGPQWPGGFYCPCHGSRFDLAGRVFKNVPAPLNLVVPEYSYLGDSRLVIGAAPPKT